MLRPWKEENEEEEVEEEEEEEEDEEDEEEETVAGLLMRLRRERDGRRKKISQDVSKLKSNKKYRSIYRVKRKGKKIKME